MTDGHHRRAFDPPTRREEISDNGKEEALPMPNTLRMLTPSGLFATPAPPPAIPLRSRCGSGTATRSIPHGLPGAPPAGVSIVPHRISQQDVWRVQAGTTVVADFVDLDEAQWLFEVLGAKQRMADLVERWPARHSVVG